MVFSFRELFHYFSVDTQSEQFKKRDREMTTMERLFLYVF
jgi:hypothetical protein